MNTSPAKRLEAIDDHLARIERLQKELRTGITNVAEEVRVAAAQLRRHEKAQRTKIVRVGYRSA